MANEDRNSLDMYHHENMALRVTPSQEPSHKEKTWWYPIDGDTAQTTTWADWWLVYRLKQSSFKAGYAFTWIMVKIRRGMADLFLPLQLCLLSTEKGLRMLIAMVLLAPKVALEALDTMADCVYGMRDGGRDGIFTTSYLMVGRKPEGWVHPGPK